MLCFKIDMDYRQCFLISALIFSIQSSALAQMKCSYLFTDLKGFESSSTKQPTVSIVVDQLPKLLSSIDPDTLKYLTNGETNVESTGNHYEIDINNHNIESSLVITKNFGLSVFKNNIYLSKYYFYRYKKSGLPMGEFSQNQPWFKWNYEKGEYTLERSGATENIINNLFNNEETVTLYRGTHSSEKDYMKTIEKMTEKDAIESIENHLNQGRFNAYFFTPSKSSAEAWVKSENGLVEVKIPKRLILNWAKENAIYAGAENPYFEFAFFNPFVILQLAKYYN